MLNCFQQASAAADIQIDTVVLKPAYGKPIADATYLDVEALEHTRPLRQAFANQVDLQADYDLVLCHRYRAFTLGQLMAVPKQRVVVLAHEFGLLDNWRRRFYRRVRAKEVRFAGVSPKVSEALARVTGMGMVIPNVIDLAAFDQSVLSREQARVELGMSESGSWVGVIGRLHYKKRPELALQAFQRFKADHPEAEIAYLGEGSSQTRQTLEDGGARLLGNVSDARRYLRAFDAVLHTGDVESFGMVLLEAMAAGVPAVAISGGGPEYVLGDLGFYPEEDNARGYAQALTHALNADVNDIAARGRARIERLFSIRALADLLTNLVHFVDQEEADPFVG